MILVTGASGRLGRLVVESLLRTIPSGQIVAAVRQPSKIQDLADRGVVVREADYERPDLWPEALEGVRTVFLICSSDIDRRDSHHGVVLEAAREAGTVTTFAYTSLLHADVSTYVHADSDRRFESAIAASGMKPLILRYPWFSENYAELIHVATQTGELVGAAGDGLIRGATREDLAEATASLLVAEPKHVIYEFAGDTAFTLPDVAGEMSRQSGQSISYVDVSEEALVTYFTGLGYPDSVARTLANADAVARRGELAGESEDLRSVLGRPSTPLSSAVATAIAAPPQW